MKRKLVFNRWKLSSEEIKKYQDFDAIIKRINGDSSWQWRTIGYWGTVTTSAIAILFLIIHM